MPSATHRLLLTGTDQLTEDIRPEDAEYMISALSSLAEISKKFFTSVHQHTGSESLTPVQATLLWHLHQVQPCSLRDLAIAADTSMPATSAAVERLVVLGLVERTQNPTDRRQVVLQTTPKAVEHAARYRNIRIAQALALFEGLTPADREVLTRSLRRMVDILSAHPDDLLALRDRQTNSSAQ